MTAVQATPATWRLVLDARVGRGARRRKALCGGEAVDAVLAGRLAGYARERESLRADGDDDRSATGEARGARTGG